MHQCINLAENVQTSKELHFIPPLKSDFNVLFSNGDNDFISPKIKHKILTLFVRNYFPFFFSENVLSIQFYRFAGIQIFYYFYSFFLLSFSVLLNFLPSFIESFFPVSGNKFLPIFVKSISSRIFLLCLLGGYFLFYFILFYFLRSSGLFCTYIRFKDFYSIILFHSSCGWGLEYPDYALQKGKKKDRCLGYNKKLHQIVSPPFWRFGTLTSGHHSYNYLVSSDPDRSYLFGSHL